MGWIADRMSQAQYKLEENTNSPFGTWPEKLKLKQELLQEDNTDENEQQEAWANSRSYDQSSKRQKKAFHPEGRRQHGLW